MKNVLLVALCAVFAIIGIYMPFLMAIVPFIVAYLYLTDKKVYACIGFIVAIICCFVIVQPVFDALLLMILLIPQTVSLIVLFNIKIKVPDYKKLILSPDVDEKSLYNSLSNRAIMAIHMLVVTLSNYLFMTLPSYLSSGKPFEILTSIINSSLNSIIESGEISSAGVKLAEQMRDIIPDLFLPFIVTSSMITAIVGVALLIKFSGRKLLLFRQWSLPKGTVLGGGLMVAAAYVYLLNEYSNAEAVYLTIVNMYTFLLSLQGLSFMTFLIINTGLNHKLRCTILYASVIILMPISIYILSLLGALEQLLQFRKKYISFLLRTGKNNKVNNSESDNNNEVNEESNTDNDETEGEK